MFNRSLIFFVLACFVTTSVVADEFDVRTINQDVYLLKSLPYGTNMGAIKTSNGLLLIDPAPGEDNLANLSELLTSLFDQQVSFIANTHNHSDHSGGNHYFLARHAEIVSAGDERADIEAYAALSHSSSDVIYYHPAGNVIFVGDIFDNSWHPTFYAGGLQGFEKAMERILSLGDESTLVVPGHGQPTSKATLRDFAANTRRWVMLIERLQQQEVTPVEMLEHPEVLAFASTFNIQDQQRFISAGALQRFINRTLTTLAK